MTEPRTCGRCGAEESRANPIKLSLVNLSREAREDGYPNYAAEYDHGERCVDRDACRVRARVARNPE